MHVGRKSFDKQLVLTRVNGWLSSIKTGHEEVNVVGPDEIAWKMVLMINHPIEEELYPHTSADFWFGILYAAAFGDPDRKPLKDILQARTELFILLCIDQTFLTHQFRAN